MSKNDPQTTKCLPCGGTGWVCNDQDCPDCNGTGKVVPTQTTVESILISAEARMRRMSVANDYFRRREMLRPKKRNHPKRHGENKERSFTDRAKAEKHIRVCKEFSEARKKYIKAARAYWKAEGNHP